MLKFSSLSSFDPKEASKGFHLSPKRAIKVHASDNQLLDVIEQSKVKSDLVPEFETYTVNIPLSVNNENIL